MDSNCGMARCGSFLEAQGGSVSLLFQLLEAAGVPGVIVPSVCRASSCKSRPHIASL